MHFSTFLSLKEVTEEDTPNPKFQIFETPFSKPPIRKMGCTLQFLHQEFLLEWLQIQIINQNNRVYTGTVDGSEIPFTTTWDVSQTL